MESRSLRTRFLVVVDAALHIADHVPFSDDPNWDISRFEPAYGVG